MLGPLLGCIAVLLLLSTLIARIRLRWWWIRSFEFPRLQIALLAGVCALASWMLLEPGKWRMASTGLSLLTLLIQLRYIIPWTRLWPVQVKSTHEAPSNQKITLLIANVLTPNRQADKLLSMIEQYQPDIVLTLESDQWWQDQLDQA